MPRPRKPDNQRARRNLDTSQRIELEFEPGQAPDLPTVMIDESGELMDCTWSPLTIQWWRAWKNSPQANVFSVSDWNSLLSTAFVADMFFRTRKAAYAAELRQREAAFGATPIDRLRLRMAWNEDKERGIKVSEAEERRRQKEARDRYEGLRVVGDDTPGGQQ